MKKLFCLLLCLCLLAGCAAPSAPEAPAETQEFVDSCGRTVQVPQRIGRVAVTGVTAQMFLLSFAPEKLVGVARRPSEAQIAYLPQEFQKLPELGQLYGGRGDQNLESLIAAKPQIILDLGDQKVNHAQDMQQLQEQTGIPTVFIQASGATLPQAYRTLGALLDVTDADEARALLAHSTLKEG